MLTSLKMKADQNDDSHVKVHAGVRRKVIDQMVPQARDELREQVRAFLVNPVYDQAERQIRWFAHWWIQRDILRGKYAG